MLAAPLARSDESHKSLRRTCIALLCTWLMTACASGFFYNRLDTLASWYFEDLVSLTDDQRHELRDWLERTLNWHRHSEMHLYARFVRDIADELAAPGNRSTYEKQRERFDLFVRNLADKTTPEASRLLLSLSAAQTDEMLSNLADKSRKRRDKNAKLVANDKWQDEQQDDIETQLKRWTGSVDSAQSRIVATTVGELEPTYLDWSASQERWRNALRTALNGDHADTSTQQRVQSLLSEPERQWTAGYAQKIARNRDRYLNMLASLDASLSPAQRTHLRDELKKLAGQLDKLAEGKE
jgi:Family of unknown function (DUF6279)